MELPSLEQGKGMILCTKEILSSTRRCTKGTRRVHTAAHCYKHEEEKLHKGAVTEQTNSKEKWSLHQIQSIMLQIPRRRRSHPATTAQHHNTLPPCPRRHLQEGGGARCTVVDLSRQDMGFLPGMERAGEGTNLDGASKEGNGTGRCHRRRG